MYKKVAVLAERNRLVYKAGLASGLLKACVEFCGEENGFQREVRTFVDALAMPAIWSAPFWSAPYGGDYDKDSVEIVNYLIRIFNDHIWSDDELHKVLFQSVINSLCDCFLEELN